MRDWREEALDYKEAIALIRAEFPNKEHDWAPLMLDRAIRNIEGEATPEALAEILKEEFGIELRSTENEN